MSRSELKELQAIGIMLERMEITGDKKETVIKKVKDSGVLEFTYKKNNQLHQVLF